MNVIAHYKMNENTAGDNAELVTDGDMDVAGSWTLTGTWAIGGGVLTGTGDSTWGNAAKQNLTSRTLGAKYKFQYEITANNLVGYSNFNLSSYGLFGGQTLSGTVEVHTYFFVATNSDVVEDVWFLLNNGSTGGSISIDDVSVKLCAVEDSSGNDHDGIAQQDTDAIHQVGVGYVNGAFDFTPNDYIEIADQADFTPILTPFSISAWCYMNDVNEFVIVSKGVFNTSGEWRFSTETNDKLYAILMDESEASCYIGRIYTTALSINTWYHTVMTYDGGKTSDSIKLYLNGARVDNDYNQNAEGDFDAVSAEGHAIWIGRDADTYANGLIDNMIFFNHELHEEQVKALYHGGHGTEIVEVIDLDRRIQRRQ